MRSKLICLFCVAVDYDYDVFVITRHPPAAEHQFPQPTLSFSRCYTDLSTVVAYYMLGIERKKNILGNMCNIAGVLSYMQYTSNRLNRSFKQLLFFQIKINTKQKIVL